MTAPRMLLVTFNRLFPADQGNARRIMQLVRLYRQRGFDIDLVYHNEEGLDAGLSAALQRQFSRVCVVRSGAPKTIQQPEHLARIEDWYDPAVGQACQQMHRLRGYSLVHVNYIWYAPVLQHFGRDVVKVLDTHDVFANRATKYRQAGMAPQWFSTSFAQEDAALRMADAALAIQKEEGAEWVERRHQNILYLPYVEPALRPFTPPTGSSRPLTLGYLGSANDWNIRSMAAFCTSLQKHADRLPLPLLIAGGITRHVRPRQGLIPLGFVKELHTFYDAIDIAINPMVGGTGLKIKTVEPLCYGKPVLTTPAGAQGLGHLWQLPVLESPDALVDYLLHEITDVNAPAVQALTAAAKASREALDAEYSAQLQRFDRWLASRGLLADLPKSSLAVGQETA